MGALQLGSHPSAPCARDLQRSPHDRAIEGFANPAAELGPLHG